MKHLVFMAATAVTMLVSARKELQVKELEANHPEVESPHVLDEQFKFGSN